MRTISPTDAAVAGAWRPRPAAVEDGPGVAPSAARRRIICVGQVTADMLLLLDQPLLLGDQVEGRATQSMGGTAAIVAHNASLAGGHVAFVGHVGADAEGAAGMARLRTAGVSVGATVATPASRQVIILVHPDGQRTMVATSPAPAWAELEIGATADDIVFFEGWHLFDPPSCPAYAELVRSAVRAGAFVVLDVCSIRAASDASFPTLLRSLGSSLVLANAPEATAYRLLDDPPAPTVIAHAGPEPTTVLTAGAFRRVQVAPAPVLDTTGAGDTFAAGLMVALSAGVPVTAAVARAHRLAREVIAIPGALLPLTYSPSLSSWA